MKPRLRVSCNQGFTLIEVLVAMTIFGVGILGVVTSLSLATQSNASARRLVEAAHLADHHMAAAVGVKADALDSDSGEQGAFQWRKTYERKTEELILATVVVEWKDRGETQQYELNQIFLPQRQDG